MSVDIEPAELGFRRPFNREVSQTLHLRNPNRDAIAFKVKTTAPKHYCVRPNSGRIEAGKQVEVQVLLQAMKEEPPLDIKCKDKFLVQAVAITGDMEYSNITSIFDKATKPSIQERKIRVNFLTTDEPATPLGSGETNGIAFTEDEPPSYASLGASYETPTPASSKKPTEGAFVPTSSDLGISSEREATPPLSKEISSPSASGVLDSGAVSEMPNSVEDLKSQLAQANAQIQKLREQLTDQGLRYQKPVRSPVPMLQQQQPQLETGVPVQIVAGLCLLCFLLAYFFF